MSYGLYQYHVEKSRKQKQHAEEERRQTLRAVVAPLKTLAEHEQEAEDQRLMEEYESFIELNAPKPPPLIKCDDCDRTFGSAQALASHRKYKH